MKHETANGIKTRNSIDDLKRETGEEELEMNLPFDRAFDACMHAIQNFVFHDFEQFDPVEGTINARVDGPGLSTTGLPFSGSRQSRITFALKKAGSHKTRIMVTSRSILPVGYAHPDAAYPSNPLRDRQNLTAITAYIRESESQPVQVQDTFSAIDGTGIPKERWQLIEPDLAAFMSLVVPGLGQNYAGRYIRAITIAVMVFAGLVFFIVPGVLIWIAGIYDAYRVARNVNRESLPFVPLQEELLIIYAFIVIGILGFVFSSGLVGFFPFRM